MRSLILIAALAVSLLPQAATAGSRFDERNEAYLARETLRTVCMKHRLNREGALRQAETDGWQRLPDGAFPKIGKLHDVIAGLHLTNLAARWKPSPRGGMVLLLGDGGKAGEGCAVAFHAPFEAASSVIGGHFMLPIKRFETVSPNYHLWAFVEEEGKRRRAVKSYFGKIDTALIAKATATHSYATIAVIGHIETGTAIFLYSIPPRLSAPPPEQKPSAFTPNPAFDRSSCQAARDAWLARHGPSPSSWVRFSLESGDGVVKFLRADIDCDQRLTREEYVEWKWAQLRSDTGVDGEISRAEYLDQHCSLVLKHLDPVAQRRQCENIWGQIFRRLKTPTRDVITKESYSRLFVAQFRKADRNRDGYLTINKERRLYFYD